jgi:hypothetical protein
MIKLAIFLFLCLDFILFGTAWCACNTTVTCTNGESGVCRQPASLSISDIQDCVTASAASDGTYYRDGIYLPSGSASLTSQLTLNKAGLILKGNGSANTSIQSSVLDDAISIAAQMVRITGIHFISSSPTNRYTFGAYGHDFRIDNCLFTGTISSYNLRGGSYRGLLDNNTFTMGDQGGILYLTGNEEFIIEHIDFTNFTSKPWIFFEDNIVNYGGDNQPELLENDDGGYIYIRWNTFNETSSENGASIFEQHNRSAGYGGRVQIVHDNRINMKFGGYGRVLYWRAGTGLVYNNKFDYSVAGSLQSPFLQLRSYRAASSCDDGSTNTSNTHSSVNPYFTGTMVARCCSTSYNYSGFVGEGYPCVGAPGVGYWGDENWKEPIYFWNNTTSPNGSTWNQITSISVDSPEDTYIQANRDYCIGTSQPESCGGVALNYTPYTYPHPLRGESTAPSTIPGGVTISGGCFGTCN